MNLAINMGQMSASGTYQTQLQKNQDDFKKLHGTNAQGQDWLDIQDNAQAAAKKDGALNAVAAMMLNKLSFHNILTPSRSIQEAIAANGLDYGNKIGINSASVAEKTGEKLFVKADGWEGFKQSFLSADLGNIFAHGLTFGTQMTTMSAIDKATEAYYSAVYNKKNLSWTDAVKQGIDAQFTKEGAKTFISGFLTGAIGIGVVGEKFTQGAKYGVERIRDRFDEVGKQERQERSAQNAADAKIFVDQFNELRKNPVNDQLKYVILQKEFAEKIASNLANSDKKGAQDAKSDATLVFLANAAKNGFMDVYLDHLKDYTKNLTSEELFAKFYGKDVEFNPDQHADLTKRLDTFFKQANDVRKIHNELIRKFPNPYNPYRFKQGTPEREAAMSDWNNFKESIALATYHKALTQDYVERLNNIMNDNGLSKGINNLGGFKSLPFTTVQALTDSSNLAREITSLQEQLKTSMSLIADTTGTEARQDAEYQKSKLNALTDYNQHLSAFQNAYREATTIKDPQQRQNAIDKAREDHQDNLQSTLQTIANIELKHNNLDAITTDDLERGMSKFMDYYQLTVDHGFATTYTNTILDPVGWGHYVGSMRLAREKAKNPPDTTQDKTTPPKAGEPTQKEFDGNLHGWNPKTKSWEPIVKGDIYDSKTGKWGPAPEPPEDKTKAEREKQETILKTHIDATNEAKIKYEENSQALTKAVDGHQQKVTDLDEHTKSLKTDLDNLKTNINLTPSEKATLVATIQKNIDKANTLKTGLAQNLTLLKEQQSILQSFSNVVNEYNKYLQQWQEGRDLIDTNKKPIVYAEIQGEMKHLGDEKTKLEQFLTDVKSKLKDINEQVKTVQEDFDFLSKEIDKSDVIRGTFDALKNLTTKEQYQKALTDLFAQENKKSAEIQDKELLSFYKNLLGKINKSTAEPEDINNILLQDLDDSVSTHLDLINNQKELIESQKEKEDALYKLEDRLAYLNTIGKTLFAGGIAPPKFPEPIYPEDIKDHDEDEPDTTDVERARNSFGHYNLDEFTKPFNKTQLRSHQPEHFEVESIKDRDGKNARIKVSTGENKNNEVWVTLDILDQSRFSSEDLNRLDTLANKILDALSDHLADNQDIKDFKTVRIGNLEYDLKHFANDELVTETEGTPRMANTIVEIPLDMQGENKAFLMPFNKDYDPHGIVTEDPNNIKIAIVNVKGEPIDKNGNVVESKDINYASIPFDESFINSPIEEQRELLERLYDGTITDEDKKTYLLSQWGHPEGFKDEQDMQNYIEDTIQKIQNYRQLHKYIQGELAAKRPVLLQIETKTVGIPVFEKAQEKDGKKVVPKNNLINRIVKPSKTFEELYHPNGQPVEVKFGDKGNLWFETKDGQQYPAESSKFTPEQINNVANAIDEYFQLNTILKSLRSEDEQVKRDFIRNKFLKSTLNFNEPTFEKDKDNEEIHNENNQKDWLKNGDPKLGKNSIWISGTKLYFPVAHSNKTITDKLEVLVIDWNDADFMDNLKGFLEELPFNISKKAWNNLDPYRVPDFSKDDYMTNGEKFANYRQYTISKDIIQTKMIEYGTKDANGNTLPQQKSVSLLFDLPQRDIILGKIEKEVAEIKPKTPITDIEAKKAEIVNNAEANKDYEILNILDDLKKGANKHLDDRLTAIVKDRMGLPLTVREYLLKGFPGIKLDGINECLSLTFPQLLRQIDSYKQSNGINYAEIDSLPIIYRARIISELAIKGIDVDGQTKLSDIVEHFTELAALEQQPEIKPATHNIIASDYLLTGGIDVILSSDYFLQALSGAFITAGDKINIIRNKYAKEIIKNGFEDLKSFINTPLYNSLITEIKNAIKEVYNNEDADKLFEDILKYPTGLPFKEGNRISIVLDKLNDLTKPEEAELQRLKDLYESMTNPDAQTKETVENKDNLTTKDVLDKLDQDETKPHIPESKINDLKKDCDDFLGMF